MQNLLSPEAAICNFLYKKYPDIYTNICKELYTKCPKPAILHEFYTLYICRENESER